MLFEVELLHLVIGDLLPFLTSSVSASSMHPQPGLGGGTANILEHGVQTAQRLARPIQADLTKEPMLDGIPFRTPGRIMADGHAESIAITERLLQLELKAARPTAIAASGICQDQELCGAGKALSPLLLPPAGQSGHGKLRPGYRQRNPGRPSHTCCSRHKSRRAQRASGHRVESHAQSTPRLLDLTFIHI